MDFYQAYGQELKTEFDPVYMFDRLAYLKPYQFAGQISSYDRIGGNNDGWGNGNFLYVDENGDQVMLDVEGPGTVHRLWFAGAWDFEQTYINFYFDGEKEPRLSATMHEILSQGTAPFDYPLTGNGAISSGGNYCYVEFPFYKSLKITTNAVGKDFFYHVGFETYGVDKPVQTWTPDHDNTDYVRVWNEIPQDPKTNLKSEIATGKTVVSSDSVQRLAKLKGCGAVSSIRLTLPEISVSNDKGMSLLNDLSLQIYWDGEREPSVNAPLGALFGLGNFGLCYSQGLPAGMDSEGTLYCYFPMPYQEKAEIQVTSRRTADTEISYEIIHIPVDEKEFEKMGHFKTNYTVQDLEAGDGSDYCILDTEGTGHLVGIVQSFIGDTDQRYLEGDERIYVDRGKTPVWIGTGTEDLYGGGGYFINGPFSLAFHGNPEHMIDGEEDKVSAYRYLIYDPIPFRSHIKVGLEHGSDLDFDMPESTSSNNANVQVASLAYYYLRPENSMYLTDYIDIGNPQSEKQHKYTAAGETWSGKLTATYEGNEEDIFISDTGRTISDSSEFTLSIEEDNAGVILRRTFDQSKKNQKANVYIDGDLAGVWYCAGENPYHRWRDSDFVVSPELTQGKDLIHVRIECISDSDWSEYAYEAYSIGYKKASFINSLFKKEITEREREYGNKEEWPLPENHGQQDWEWVRSDPEKVTFYPEEHAVTVTAQAGELYHETNSAKNLLLHAVPENDFSVSCKVSFPEIPDKNFQQAGLLIYQDDDNYLKVSRGCKNKSQLCFSREIDKIIQERPYPDNVESTDLYLRLTKIGNEYTAFYSLNGEKYSRLGDPFNADLQGELKAGIFAFTGAAEDIDVTFSEFEFIDYGHSPGQIKEEGKL